jgi:predicted enzyme related to lactoylglutathione lyase
MSRSSSTADRFVWYDLMTNDMRGSLAFYTDLFGWTAREVPMGEMGTYTMIRSGETDVGGIVPLDPSQSVPSHWIGYVATGDVDAAAGRAPSLGGKVCVPPTDIPGVGRFAVLEDPAGAVISPITFKEGPGPEPQGPPATGTFCWNELLTTDTDAAARFYEGLFGWTVSAMDMGAHGTYSIFRRGEADAGGMMKMPAEASARPHWLPYVAVSDVDESVARVAALNGRVHVRPCDIPNVGRFAVVADPAGASFAVFKGRGA